MFALPEAVSGSVVWLLQCHSLVTRRGRRRSERTEMEPTVRHATALDSSRDQHAHVPTIRALAGVALHAFLWARVPGVRDVTRCDA